MTVCIAARSYTSVFLISDRMITSHDIQFEPPVEKIFFLTPSIAVMAAGDSAFHHEVLSEVLVDVQRRILAEPDNWWNIKDVVDLYIRHRNSAKLRRSEAAILGPLGLDRHTFLQNQKMMDQSLVDTIARDLIGYEVPSVEVIIAGLDHSGGQQDQTNTHIYSIFNDYISCDDIIGFRAIGSGSRHADSQFMLARHGWNSTTSDTVLLTYCAKKNAEVAPGVGTDTDMFMIGPRVGQQTRMSPPVMDKLEVMYKKIKSKISKIQTEANKEMDKYVTNLGDKPAASTAQADRPTPEEATTAGADAEASGKPFTAG